MAVDGGNHLAALTGARCHQPPSAPPLCTGQTARIKNKPHRIVRLSDGEDGDTLLATLDLGGGNKLESGDARDGLGHAVGDPELDLPLGPKRARLRQSRQLRRKGQLLGKRLAVPEVELEPEQDTAGGGPLSLPEQPNKWHSDTSVVSDAGHPPANINGKITS